MQNIEFKAELRDIEAARAQCRVLGADHKGKLRQVDTYYRLSDGRLKRRCTDGHPTEWIFYHRKDTARPCTSNYTILDDEQARRRWGTQSLRQWIEIRKTRDLWLIDNVRVHLDEVEELGTFLEFEAIVSREFNSQECHLEVAEMRDIFSPVIGEPLSCSYSDMLAQLMELNSASED